MPKVSIIVPIYNAEKYVERCIQSILKQTYRDFELLLMDDGSKDSSGEICDRAAAEDSRIRVIHKENSGVSDTRNQALKLATGVYVQFLDADDWITENTTELFVRTMEQGDADMVISDFYRVNGENVARKGAIDKDGLLTIKEFTGELITRPADFYYGVLWNKFFRRSILKEFNILMDENISWCEDFIFILEYLKHCSNVYVLKVPTYYYVKTEGSLVSQGMSVKKTVKTKQLVFKYYSAYCMEIFGKEEYERRSLQVYQYFIDMARDGMILPAVFPTTKKLGEEREGISAAASRGEGKFFSLYRERKLQDRLFEIVGVRNGLLAEEIKLLYFLSDGIEELTVEEVEDILNMTYGKLNSALWKLRSEGLITVRSRSGEIDSILKWFTKEDEEAENEDLGKAKLKKAMRAYIPTKYAAHILNEVLFMMNDLDQIQYEGFTEEERVLFEKLEERRQYNIQRALH